MISQFFILSLRGDTIITRNFRGNVVKSLAEIFFRKVKFWSGDAPPIFNVDGVSFIYLKTNGLYFVATTSENVSPSYVVELLTKMTKVFKDFCGVLNEESIRKNFVLIYELLDEMVDYGHPQTTSTEHLKMCVYNEAALIEAPKIGLNLPQWSNAKTVSSNAVQRPVGAVQNDPGKKNEIFVDILERLTVLMTANGFVIASEINGAIQMKSYLYGNPELQLVMNDDLVIKEQSGNYKGGYGAVVLDDCNFHECVDLHDFGELRTLSFYPPDGEFSVMNYRIIGDFRVPFKFSPFVEQITKHQLEVNIKVRADVPEQNYGGNVQIFCLLPKSTASVSTELIGGGAGQSAEYLPAEHKVVWDIKKFQGGSEASIRCRVNLSTPLSSNANIKKEIGPVSMNFEIPMYNVSNLQVKHLKILERHKSSSPCRWVRYVTQSASYVCRF